MTVYEYRKQNPRCIYCKHSEADIFFLLLCKAKLKRVFNCAEKCPLYEPEKMRGEKVE